MYFALLLCGLGFLGLILACFALARTLHSGAAKLRGGRRISRQRHAALYWANVAALCVLLLISIGLMYLGKTLHLSE
jgi:hypothetical protein